MSEVLEGLNTFIHQYHQSADRTYQVHTMEIMLSMGQWFLILTQSTFLNITSHKKNVAKEIGHNVLAYI